MFRAGSPLRSREVERLGGTRLQLQRLYERGLLERLTRGVYVSAGVELSAHQSLVEVALRVPRAVFCLLTALKFHNLTTQLPHEVWIALPPRVHRPAFDYPPLSIVTMSGVAFSEGIEEHTSDGVTLRIYSPAKTVVDCFKFRNKIGKDVAIEALRDYRRQFREQRELLRLARMERLTKVMLPYLESIE